MLSKKEFHKLINAVLRNSPPSKELFENIQKDASHLRKSGNGIVELDIGTLKAWLFSEGNGGKEKSSSGGRTTALLPPPATAATTETKQLAIPAVVSAEESSRQEIKSWAVQESQYKESTWILLIAYLPVFQQIKAVPKL